MAFPDEKSIFDFLSMEYKKPEERVDGKSVVLTQAVSPIQEEPVQGSVEKEEQPGSFTVKPSVVEPQTKLSVKSPTISSETFIIKVPKKKRSKTVKKPKTTKKTTEPALNPLNPLKLPKM